MASRGNPISQTFFDKSLHGLKDEIEGILKLANGQAQAPTTLSGDSVLSHRFWAPNRLLSLGAKVPTSHEHDNLQARRRARDEALRERHGSHLASSSGLPTGLTYDQTFALLRQQASDTRKAMNLPGELPVDQSAPSRCPPKGTRLIEHENEVQRASRRLFQPNCEPRYRRVMVEMTPGIGKTCIYVGVIADFLGKRCQENGKYFDILVLGDPDIFKSFRDGLRSCPALASLYEYETISDAAGKQVRVRKRLLLPTPAGGTAKPPPPEHDGLVLLRDVNPGTDGACAVATRILPGPAPAAAPDEVFEEEKDERRCGSDRLVWAGSRVVFMPYALAARWVVFSGGGVTAADATQHMDFVSEADKQAFLEDAQGITWAALHQRYPQLKAQDLKVAETSTASKYKKAGIVLGSPNTVIIVDECQNLSTPSRWAHPKDATRKQSAFLSEALWRQSWDPQASPYLFAGTGTPNIGTGVASSICLMQIINGRGKASSFLPYLLDEQERPTAIETLKDFRELLSSKPDAKLQWRDPKDRHARYLMVNPRTFLDDASGFVRNMTASTEPFPLYLPRFAQGPAAGGIVAGWRQDSSRFTYAQATLEVRKCLPFAPPEEAPAPGPKAKARAKAKAKAKAKTALGFQNELAYKTFVCAASEADIAQQASQIYKPIYSSLNRQLLQEVILDRVFIVNSYYDAHYYPTAAPTSSSPPVTQVVVPEATLVCWPEASDARLESPDLEPPPRIGAVSGATPARLRAEASFPRAILTTPEGPKPHYPWRVPPEASSAYLRELQRPSIAASLGALSWSERSFWAAPDKGHGRHASDLQGLCRRLVETYWKNPSRTDLSLENYLRDAVAYNSPKLVAAADAMYSDRSGTSFCSPTIPVFGKSFLFLNVLNRRDATFAGLDDNYFLIVTSFYLRLRLRPYLQWLHPELSGAQHRIAWLDALKHRSEVSSGREPLDLREVSSQSGQHWSSWLEKHRQASALPSIYALADEKMIKEDSPRQAENASSPYSDAVHARYLSYLSGQRPDLNFEDILQLMGLKTLRDAMKDALNGDVCGDRSSQASRLAPAGQSALVAADGAHKAVDLRCVGFNLSFGPMPRGKRIQEIGRNWRSCSFGELGNKERNWQVHIRQLFLGAPPSAPPDITALLERDLLLDSFYEAQDEALQWLRMITVSAGVACSLWWAYSEWPRQFEAYRERHPRETSWFYGAPKLSTPCLDAGMSTGLAPGARKLQEGADTPEFFRCSKTSRAAGSGTVVRAPSGAFLPEELVGEAHPPDPSATRGTASSACTPFTPPPPVPAPRRVLPGDALLPAQRRPRRSPSIPDPSRKSSSFFYGLARQPSPLTPERRQ